MKLNIFIAYASLLLLSSCFRPYYVAPVHNVPLFKEKNEIRGSASVAVSESVSSDNAQLAYSATNHIAFIGNYMGVNARDQSWENSGKGRYFDIGGGYYTTFEKHIVLEMLGGFGQCAQSHIYNDLIRTPNGQVRVTGDAQLSFNKIFFQPSVGLSTDGLDLAFTAMLSNVQYTRINHTLNTLTEFDYKRLAELSANPNIVMLEPSVTVRGGWQYMKVQFQYTRSFVLSGPIVNPFSFIRGRFGFGLYFSFTQRYLDKNKATK